MTEWGTTHRTETFKSLVTLSVEALKMLALINGGAAVAVLTYLGNLAGKASAPVVLPPVRAALLAYGGGVLAVALAFMLAYLAQLRLYQESVDPFRKEFHWMLITAAAGLALVSAVAFGVGCWLTSAALTQA